MTLEEVQNKVSVLGLPANDYVLFGSLPLLTHGLIDSVNDIDILARGSAWEQAQTFAKAELAPMGEWRVSLEDIEIYNAWLGMDVDALINRAMFVNGLPYADLGDVLEFKQKLNRPKDAEHIRRIKNYLLGIRNQELGVGENQKP
jgi:hypothetical protein